MGREVLLNKSDKLLPSKAKTNLGEFVFGLEKLSISMYNYHTRSQQASDLHAIWMCLSTVKYLHFHSWRFKNSPCAENSIWWFIPGCIADEQNFILIKAYMQSIASCGDTIDQHWWKARHVWAHLACMHHLFTSISEPLSWAEINLSFNRFSSFLISPSLTSAPCSL